MNNARASRKTWQVYPDGSENILFQGNKTQCLKYIKTHKLRRQIQNGLIRLGYVIWDADWEPTLAANPVD